MLEKITQIIQENTGNYEHIINEDTFLLVDLGFNSLVLLNQVCIVEDEFDIKFPTVLYGNLKQLVML